MRVETARNWVDGALWGVSAALLALSFVLSWGPPPDIGPEFDWADKAWHLLGYGALAGTLLLAAVWRPGRGEGRFPGAGYWVTGLVLSIAWLTEALQAPLGRDFDPIDGLADLAGTGLAFVIWKATSRAARS